MVTGVMIAAAPKLTTNSRRFTWVSSPWTIIVGEIEPTIELARVDQISPSFYGAVVADIGAYVGKILNGTKAADDHTPSGRLLWPQSGRWTTHTAAARYALARFD